MTEIKIPVLDLKPQYEQIKDEVQAAINCVLRLESGQFIMGPDVKLFEQEVAEYLGVKQAIALNIEQNPRRAQQVNQGDNYIGDVQDEELKQVVSSGHLQAVSSFDGVAEIDVIVICVPTPLTKNLTPNLSYIESVTEQISQRLRPGQLVTLESTTYPGTTDEVMRPLLEKTSGLQQGQDFFLAHSPERVDPGNQRYTTKNTNKVVGASDPHSLAVATLFYEQTIETVVPVSSAKAAELVKVFENTF